MLLVTLATYAWLAVGYAAATPLWQNPDEPAHFNYIVDVARTGGLPVLQRGDYDVDLLERLKNGRLRPDDSVAAIRYESWQPPLYYVLAAQVYRAVPAGDASDDPTGKVRPLRLFDAMLGALTVTVGYLCGRSVAGPGRGWLAVAVPVAMVGVPMFTAVSAAITDDALTNLLAALLTLALLRLVGRPATARLAMGVGVLLGLGVLTKLLLAVFAPIALLVLLAAGRRLGVRGRALIAQATAMAGAALIVVAPWLVRQGLTYGWTDLLATRQHDVVVVDQPRFPGWSGEYVRAWLTMTYHSFWAQFGWMAIPAPDRLYWIWGAFTALAVAGLVVWLGRRRPAVAGSAVAALAATGAANVGVLVYYNLTYQQAQGRYLFPSLVPICVLLILGWSALLPHRVRAPGALLGAGALVALNAYTLVRVLPGGFSG